jgi:predicted phage-related endonuclease
MKKETTTNDRNSGIGGSDCFTLIHGTKKDWNKLWEIKTGRTEPPDLSNKFNVQLGIITEQFNLHCLTQKLLTKHKNTNKGMSIETSRQIKTGDIYDNKYIKIEPKVITIPDNLLKLQGHLDGAIYNGNDSEDMYCIIECKHTYQENTLANLVDFYNPQMQHYMNVFNQDLAIMSGIFGNKCHMFQVVKRDHEFIHRLENIQRYFWKSVVADKPPFDIDDD